MLPQWLWDKGTLCRPLAINCRPLRAVLAECVILRASTITRGLPGFLPLALAFRSPARTRSPTEVMEIEDSELGHRRGSMRRNEAVRQETRKWVAQGLRGLRFDFDAQRLLSQKTPGIRESH
jgi:hypothetical protein